MPGWLLVFIGGGAGSLARYAVMGWVARRGNLAFPYSTLTVNILGSIAMGLLIGWLARQLPENAQQIRNLLAVGFLGGFTTFSAFSLDTVTLIERGQWVAAGLYTVLSVGLCVIGLFAGLVCARVISL